uniref:Uncharacterized protein n=1 Tax=Acrobeloides nanus TaxID=290746 RepID=A0A914EBX3_9BILA
MALFAIVANPIRLDGDGIGVVIDESFLTTRKAQGSSCSPIWSMVIWRNGARLQPIFSWCLYVIVERWTYFRLFNVIFVPEPPSIQTNGVLIEALLDSRDGCFIEEFATIAIL